VRLASAKKNKNKNKKVTETDVGDESNVTIPFTSIGTPVLTCSLIEYVG
jgi:hypothetical protein